MEIKGKGMVIWKLKDLPGVDIEDRTTWPAAVQKALDAGLTHVVIKVVDGQWRYNMRWDFAKQQYVDDLLPDTDKGPGWVSLFKQAGIQVLGWQWNYFETWSPAVNEAIAILARVQQLGLDGMYINAEARAKNKPVATVQFVDKLKERTVPAYLASYRYPKLHPELHWQKWGELDGFMPLVFWKQATNSAQQLQWCWNQYSELYGEDIFFFPCGAAFTESGWAAQAAEVLAFLIKAKDDLQVPGVNFYRWGHAVDLNLWPTIAQFPWPVDGEPPGPPTVPVSEWAPEIDSWARNPIMPYDGPAPPPA